MMLSNMVRAIIDSAPFIPVRGTRYYRSLCCFLSLLVGINRALSMMARTMLECFLSGGTFPLSLRSTVEQNNRYFIVRGHIDRAISMSGSRLDLTRRNRFAMSDHPVQDIVLHW